VGDLAATNLPGEEVRTMMQIQVLKFRNALGLLDTVIPKKSKLPILTNVHLKNGQIIATDSTKAIAIAVPEVQGECLLPYSELTKLLKYVPGHEEVRIEYDGGKIRLTWSDGKATYAAKPIEDYPALPQLTNVQIKQTIDGEHFVAGLLSVADYCAPDKGERPLLKGVTVLLGDQIDVIGSDGFRLATKRLPVSIPPANDTKSVVIPQETVYLLGELWRRAPRNNREGTSVVDLVLPKRELELEVDASKVTMQFGIVTLYSRRIEGMPPNYHQLVPDYAPSVQLYGPDLELALRRVQVPAKVGKAILRMLWDAGAMTLSADSEEKGDIEVNFPVQTFSPGKFAIEYPFILEYVRGKPGLITLCTKDHQSPMLLRYLNAPTVVIMPRMVSWPGEPPPAEVAAATASNGPSNEDTEGPPEEEGEGVPDGAETPAT
jgi:DNA polymerase III sliding clamp (beta) subunit (PCNA family)